MQFRPHQKPPLNINFSFNDINLECVSTFTLLGFDIDTNLNWKAHIQKVTSKLSSFIYALRQLKKSTNQKTALTAYFAYAYSWLRYGIILWGNSTDAQNLFILQKRCVRILVNIKNTDSCKLHFKNLNILTLPSLYILEMCSFVKAYPSIFSKLVDQPRHHVTRRPYDLQRPVARLQLFNSSAYVMAIKIFNKLPNQLKRDVENVGFIDTLKNRLISKAYYSLREYFDEQA